MMSSLLRSIGRAAVISLVVAIKAGADEVPQIRFGSTSSEVLLAKITVSDLHKSLDFYKTVVGLKEVYTPGMAKPNIDDPAAEIIQVMLNFSGSPADAALCLIKRKGLMPTAESAKLAWVGIKTADVRAAMERAKAAGAKVKLETMQFKGVTVGIVHDPDGYVVELLQGASVEGDSAPGR